MRSPLPTLVLIILYVAMVICGPRIMRNRPAFEFKPLLFVFNSAVVALYVYLSKEVVFIQRVFQLSSIAFMITNSNLNVTIVSNLDH